MSVHVIPADEQDLHTLAVTCQCGPRVDDVEWAGRERHGLIHHDLVEPPPDILPTTWSMEDIRRELRVG